MNLGFSADGLVFMVVVPELGACRVPDLALSHFMAGADEYAAEGMPEHWSKQPSGPWTIKRDRLRILADSWDKWHQTVCDRWITEPPDASEPQAPPVVANSASNAPPPLTTGDIAFCFDRIRWNEQEWRKPLGDKPKWLQSCVVTPAQRGVSETRWNPVLIAAWLVANGHAKQNSIRARFQTKSQLSPWLEAWKTYEADNFDTP